MSHFFTLVAGECAHHEMAPFKEYESDCERSEFVQEIDCTDELLSVMSEKGPAFSLKDCANYHGYVLLEPGQIPDRNHEDFALGWIEPLETGFKAIKVTNPNAKYDYYQIGGRYSGVFPVITGLKADFDFERHVARAENLAAQQWDLSRKDFKRWLTKKELAHIHGIPSPDTWSADLHALYVAQPGLRELSDRLSLKVWDLEYVDLYLGSKSDFLINRVCELATPFAIVKNRTWLSQGEMGGFGYTYNCVSDKQWVGTIREFFKTLKADEKLWVVDCHI